MAQGLTLGPLSKVLRAYAAIASSLLAAQLLGLAMYLVNVWPVTRASIPRGIAWLAAVAVGLGLLRSAVWIRIYWVGARVVRARAGEVDGGQGDEATGRDLSLLTRLLIASGVLDFLFLPAYFASDHFLGFSLSGWRLGLVETARLLLPQAFGLAALVLAYLTHQYGDLLRERRALRDELELTV